ncbi:hypothetical protein AB0K60_17530 [Thermopolyspora sp. NPDC052614]|uniref:hypothetical protein n=1 Tax=Thermopolyspora sp. NPDC052614 TaxID=3155682 RepID=UPI003444C4D5
MRRAHLIASLLVVGGTALAVPGVPQASGRPAAPTRHPGQAPGEASGVLLGAYGPAIRSVTVIPRDPVVRARGGVDLTVEVVARGAAGPDAVTVRVEPGPPPPPPPSARGSGGPRMATRPARSLPAVSAPRSLGGDRGGWETWRFRAPVRLSRLYPPGVWTVEARVRGTSGRQAVEHETFLLRGVTRLRDLRVTPERAKQDAVRVSGRLTRLDPAGLSGQRGFRGRQVAIQRLDPRTGAWRTAAWTVTGRDGEFAASVPGRDAVRWRVVYEGDDRHAPADGRVSRRDDSAR